MSDVILYGPPQSTYVRTARMACEEKGVPYTQVEYALDLVDIFKQIFSQ